MTTTINTTHEAYEVFNPVTGTMEAFSSLLQAVTFCRFNGLNYSVSIA